MASIDRMDHPSRGPAVLSPPPDTLLRVENLTTVFDLNGRLATAVDGVSFAIGRGETLGLVGESGSGKSVTALSILRLVQRPGRIVRGSVALGGRDLLRLSEQEMRRVRGAEIALIVQEPTTALNPVFTVGDQIAEAFRVHSRCSRREALARAVELLASVSVPEPDRRIHDYPHQLSGGLRQRVLIAMAVACHPALIIADEPTTALDATIQAEVLSLLRDLKTTFDLSLLLITHDLGVIAETADRVMVMYAGRIVEEGPVEAIFHAPKHPYTQGLIASLPGGTPGAPLLAIGGAVPALGNLPPGCAFAPRCPQRFDPCETAPPGPFAAGPDRLARCYLYDPLHGPGSSPARQRGAEG